MKPPAGAKRRPVRLSRQQRSILDALAGAERGWLPTEAFHELLYGVPVASRLRTRPLTASERASLSRSLSRLENAGLIHRRLTRGAWYPGPRPDAATG